MQAQEDATIRVAPGIPTERSLKLNLADVNRPCAFALPLAPAFEPLCQFELNRPATVGKMLAQLGTWLLPRQVLFALGREIVVRGASLRHGVFHVTHRANLVAVLNLRSGRVGFAPQLSPSLLEDAQWVKRPAHAGDIPPHFIPTTVAQLSWSYVRHSDERILPTPYRTGAIYFRGAPKVPPHWLSDSQLMLLREVNAEAGTMYDLRQRTGLPLEQIEKDLTCLYFAASITSSPSKAARPKSAPGSAPASSAPELADLMRATEGPQLEPEQGRFPAELSRQYATVPAALMASTA